jgi:hypothetical protein
VLKIQKKQSISLPSTINPASWLPHLFWVSQAMTWIFKCCGLFYAQQFEVRGFVLFILVELLTIAVDHCC